MPRYGLVFALVIALAASVGGVENGSKKEPRRITRQVLEDKIRGGWAGQMIGVSYGAPTEFRSNGKIIEGNLPWTPDRVSNAIHQDDLYVDMTLAETMERLGLEATTEQYGEYFKASKYSLWHANAAARRLLNRGIKAPLSGDPKYNLHANDIDFQIESDFIGLMTPGLPQESNKYCDRVGRVMNYGDGLYGGMFVCGMYSAAFFEKDARKIVEQGLACMPPGSGYAKVIRNVLDWSAQSPLDWKKTWHMIEQNWNKDDPCPDGALVPFNIDAKLNGAYIALGLLYGKGDFAKTLEVTTRAGQDSDCNPSNAAGILGVVLGYSGIPDPWKAGIPQLADTKFEYTNSSFNDITRLTLAHAIQIVTQAGGKVTDNELTIPIQEPKAPRLEQWDMGIPDRRIDTLDTSWNWKGNWSEEHYWGTNGLLCRKTTSGTGAEATLNFTGSAIALVGKSSQEGGRADVYLDGEKAGEIDAYIVERTNDNDLWHTYGLKPGKHTVRIVTRDDTDPRSKGKKILIETAISYRPK
jgi:ADP-ribosylglycohydrolase/Carbohydrate esterase 2 N-terminal